MFGAITPIVHHDLSAAARAGNPAPDRRLREACRDFEALLIGQLFTALRAGVPDDGLFARSHGEKLFQEMLDGEYAKAISRSERLGLADLLYRQLHRPADGPDGGAAGAA